MGTLDSDGRKRSGFLSFPSPWVAQGTVVHIRRLRRELIFIDLKAHEMSNSSLFQDSSPVNSETRNPDILKLEIIMKVNLLRPETQNLASQLHVGDTLSLKGDYAEELHELHRRHVLFHALEFEIISSSPGLNSHVLKGCSQASIERPRRANIESAGKQEVLKDKSDIIWDGFLSMPASSILTSEISIQMKEKSTSVSEGVTIDNREETQMGNVETVDGRNFCYREESKDNAGKVCKYWINTKNCVHGKFCQFLHPEGEQFRIDRQLWVEKKMESKKLKGTGTGDPIDPHCKSRKSKRAAIFAEWLIATFSMSTLASGQGVLDIAGGRGSLAFCLQAVHGIKSTLIEPRVMKLNRVEQKYIKTHPEALLPNVLQTKLGMDNERNITALLSEASCLVGLHPDEATEIILKLALQHKRPFAIVPCCVFPNLFPDRLLRNGSSTGPVTTYEHFCSYLRQVAKESGAQVDVGWLEIEGKNQVIYCHKYNV